MQTLHVHAEANIGLELLSENDADLPGVYEVRVSAGLSAREAAWAALKAVQTGVRFDSPEDIALRVVDPITGVSIDPLPEPTGVSHIIGELVSKVAWELPKARVCLTMDVVYSGRCVSAEWIAKTLKEAMEREMDKHTLTNGVDATVDFFQVKTAPVANVPGAMEEQYASDNRCDYRLKEQHNSCSIEVDNGVVVISRDGSGITVQVQANHAQADDLVQDTVSYIDLEATLLESLEIGISSVRQHYKNTNPQGLSFDELSLVERANQIRLAAAAINQAEARLEAISKIQVV